MRRPWQSDLMSPGVVFVALLLIAFPISANSFWLVQIGAQTLIYGIIALGLTLLAGYGGMVSLAQMVIAGLAGYLIAILGVNSGGLGLGWPWPVVVIAAIIAATIFGTLIGVLSVRTEGIYTIMITLAIATGFFYFTRQNYVIFNGFTGFAGIKAPVIGGIDLREPMRFYYLSLAIAGLSYFGVAYLVRSTFGIALQGVRDNARRMEALGYHVKAHRISAYAIASLLAAVGGILTVWMNDRIDPASIGVGPTIDILVIAVIGGLGHPIGAFIGALIFTLLDNFAIDLIDRERFNTVIGTV
ncbi:MAG: branched-chain amino acid ABC transporter permease, partial [Hyphomicrobiales bacterium]